VEYVKNGAWKASVEKLKKYRYPALILALGLLLLLLPGEKENEKTAVAAEPLPQETGFDLTAFTVEAEAVLSGIEGAGEVKLLLSLENDGSRSYLADRSENGMDNTQTQTEYVLRDADGEDVPILVEYSFPQFRGAVVVCQGADSSTVTLALKEALSGLTGLGMDKITVLKMR